MQKNPNETVQKVALEKGGYRIRLMRGKERFQTIPLLFNNRKDANEIGAALARFFDNKPLTSRQQAMVDGAQEVYGL